MIQKKCSMFDFVNDGMNDCAKIDEFYSLELSDNLGATMSSFVENRTVIFNQLIIQVTFACVDVIQS